MHWVSDTGIKGGQKMTQKTHWYFRLLSRITQRKACILYHVGNENTVTLVPLMKKGREAFVTGPDGVPHGRESFH